MYFGKKISVFLCLLSILCAGNASAEVEFFFNSSPSDPPKLINSIAKSFPLASVGHGTMYVSSACRDSGSEGNLIRPCTALDKDKGLVISFDVDLQKNTGYYFLAVTRDEFLYGGLDKKKLPPRITRAIIDRMDEHFYAKFPLLRGDAYFRRHVEDLAKTTGGSYDDLARVLVDVSRRGVTKKNFEAALKYSGIKIDARWENDIWKLAKYFEKNGISPEGMSRRVVAWAVLFYEAVWGLKYPTTEQEERELITYINSISKEDANILSVNCVMPMDIAGGALTGKASELAPSSSGAVEAPRYIFVPYFVMKRLVKGAFETDINDVNEFGEFIRRPGVHMRFYPQVDIAFDADVPRAPKSVFQRGELVGFYRRYQGKYANYIDWLVDQLQGLGVKSDTATVKALQALRKEVFEEEKSLNKLRREYEGAAVRDPELAQKLDRAEVALLAKFRDEVGRIMGVQPAIE